MGRILAIGDGIVDLIRREDGTEEWHAGGAALNLAVGLSRLGHSSILAGRIGADRNGFRLVRHLRDEGVKLISVPTVDPTGVAISTRENGEPRYHFNAAMYRRRMVFTEEHLEAMAAAEVIAVNTFPFEAIGQVKDLVAARARAGGLFVLDPNPRPKLIRDVEEFRKGFELSVSGCFLVKLSADDIDILYSGNEIAAIARLQGFGVERVLLTRGPQGASFYLHGKTIANIPSALAAADVIDTMGAGDATLVAVIDWIVRRGVPRDIETWVASLRRAMRIAGATCMSKGGGLLLGGERILSD